jgi:hypothetical protein
MNEYDKAGRWLIKRDPAGFFRWLLRRPDVTFHTWIDARRHALPDQRDLVNDLVAAFPVGDGFEALCVELQAASEGGSAGRLLLGYVPRLLTEPAVPGSLPLTAAGGIVVNLSGPEQPDRMEHRPTVAPACSLVGTIGQRTLRDEDAAATLREVAAGGISWWLLAWLPLMRGGAEVGIIQGWVREARREPDQGEQGTLAGLALTFAWLAGNFAVWDRALEGFDVVKSPYLEQLREKVRALAHAEGLAEGEAEGLRRTALRQGRQRFGKAPTRKQEAQLQAITDVARLDRILDKIMTASSWKELLATP